MSTDEETFRNTLAMFIKELPVGASGTLSLVLGAARIEAFVNKEGAVTVETDLTSDPAKDHSLEIAQLEAERDLACGAAASMDRQLCEIIKAFEAFSHSVYKTHGLQNSGEALEALKTTVEHIKRLRTSGDAIAQQKYGVTRCTICGGDHHRALCSEGADDVIQIRSPTEKATLLEYVLDLLAANETYLAAVNLPVLSINISAAASSFEQMRDTTKKIRAAMSRAEETRTVHGLDF